MLVFDTSAFINGQRDHFRLARFPSVWTVIGDAMDNSAVVSPRAAYVELQNKDDDVFAWAKAHSTAFLDPTEEVQREAGRIQPLLDEWKVKGEADPWVIAEAKIRGMTVVTYEGRTFAGEKARAKTYNRSIPAACERLGVACGTLPDALDRLGVTF